MNQFAPLGLPELLTISEVSQLLKCNPATLRHWDKTGVLPAIRIGARKTRRYRRQDILHLIDKNSQPSSSPVNGFSKKFSELEDGFQHILKNSMVTLAIADTSARYTWVYNSKRFPREIMIGKTDAELSPNDPGSLELTELKLRTVRTKKKIRKELVFSTPISAAVFDITVEPVLDSHGKVKRVSCLAIDITDQHNLEISVKASQDHYRNLADSMPQLVWMANKHGKIVYYNKKRRDFVGINQIGGEYVWSPVVHPDDRLKTERSWQKAVKTGTIYQIEHRVETKHEGYRWFLSRAVPLKDDEGQIIRWYGTATDIHDLKLAELERQHLIDRLEDEKAKLSQIFAQAPAFIAVLRGENHTFETANEFYYQLIGHRDIIGRTVAEALPEVVEQGFVKLLNQVYRTGKPFKAEGMKVMLQKAGSQMEESFVTFVYQPIKSAKGKVTGIFVHGVEVTNLIKVQQQLRMNQERLSIAQEAAKLGFFEWNIEKDVNLWSKELEEMYGLREGEFRRSSEHWLELVHPEDIKKIKKDIRQALKTGRFISEWRLHSDSDQPRWLQGRGKVIKNEKGRPIRLVGANIEISEQKKVEEKLRESELKLSLFAESSLIGMLFGDVHGRVTYANDALLQMIGYTKREVQQGKVQWDALTPPEWLKIDQAKIKEAKVKGVCAPYEKEFIRKDGSKVPVLIGFILLGEKRDQSVAFILDISERKQLEQRKDEFISIASHELRTPLTTIKAYLQLLHRILTYEGNEKTLAFLNKANIQVTRLNSLITDLLDVSKMQAGKVQYTLAELSLDEVIAEAVGNIQPTANNHQIIVTGKAKVKVWGDRHRLEQVVNNLLSNAIKYSPEAKQVVLTVKRQKESVVVSVQDFGIGISKKNQAQLFTRFYRVESTAEKFSGLGIGLYISAEIIQRHLGKMWVKSTEGKGSTFFFQLPIAE